MFNRPNRTLLLMLFFTLSVFCEQARWQTELSSFWWWRIRPVCGASHLQSACRSALPREKSGRSSLLSGHFTDLLYTQLTILPILPCLFPRIDLSQSSLSLVVLPVWTEESRSSATSQTPFEWQVSSPVMWWFVSVCCERSAGCKLLSTQVCGNKST